MDIQRTEASPMVSVFMMTYNHERYLAQALDSVLAQVRDFSMEIVIGEDCSTDNTRAIVLDYHRRYPDLIRPLLPPQNIGAMNNQIQIMEACRGKYVAILEGDDYWTDVHKLVRQVNFLESHPDFSFCFHNALVVHEDGSGKASHLMTSDIKSEYSLDDITREWNIATASVVYRRQLLPELPMWARDATAADLPMFVTLANQGRVGFLPEVMSVYRINAGGVSRSGHAERFVLGLIRMHENVDRYLDYRYHQNTMKKLAEDYLILTNIKIRDLDYKAARRYLLRSLWLQLAGQKKAPTISNLKMLAGILAPGLVRRFGRGQVEASA